MYGRGRAGPSACECLSNVDCPQDDNLCNGTPICDVNGEFGTANTW